MALKMCNRNCDAGPAIIFYIGHSLVHAFKENYDRNYHSIHYRRSCFLSVGKVGLPYSCGQVGRLRMR